MSILNYVSMVSLRKKVPSQVVRGFCQKKMLLYCFLFSVLVIYTFTLGIVEGGHFFIKWIEARALSSD